MQNLGCLLLGEHPIYVVINKRYDKECQQQLIDSSLLYYVTFKKNCNRLSTVMAEQRVLHIMKNKGGLVYIVHNWSASKSQAQHHAFAATF